MILLFVPLGCWLLAARPGRARPTIAAVLAAAALTAVAALLDELPRQVHWTALIAAGCVLAVTPLIGLALVWPVHHGESGDRRGAAAALSVGCALLAGAATYLFGLALDVNGPPSRVPAASELTALPAGLHITAERSGCGGGSTNYCERELTVTGAPGQDPAQLLDQLREQLAAAGWPLTPNDSDGWKACRTSGILLDADELCVYLTGTETDVKIDLATSDSW